MIRPRLDPARWRVDFDETGFDCWKPGAEAIGARWSQVRRIGYVTENTGLAITDDYFLAFQTEDGLFLISMQLPGALRLSEWIKNTFDCRYGPKGTLSWCTDFDCVVIWPVKDASLDFHELIERESSNRRILVTYFCIDGGVLRSEKTIGGG